jgi:LytS/YehU family sensor histidine kinase
MAKKIISSPVTYTAIGYLAVVFSLLVQTALSAGYLIPGTIQSTVLGIVLVPLMALGPVVGVGLGIRHLMHRMRFVESILALAAAIPLLLLWLAALSRALSGVFRA